MSTELIKAVLIQADGVYLNSKSVNDDMPFHLWRCNSLSDVLQAEGQLGLDREIFRMLHEYASLSGDHSSLRRYRYVLKSPRNVQRYQWYLNAVNQRFDQLGKADRESLYRCPTQQAKAYRQFEQEQRNLWYTWQAKHCVEYDNHERMVKMADYTCTIRSNYFHVKDPDAFRAFMGRVYGTTDFISFWQERDLSGQPVFGFGTHGAIGGLRNAKADEDDDADESAYDEFISGLQEHVAEDDAVILLEVGHEKLRYINGSATIITSSDRDYLSISTLAKYRAATMLGNSQWDTQCEC